MVRLTVLEGLLWAGKGSRLKGHPRLYSCKLQDPQRGPSTMFGLQRHPFPWQCGAL